MGAVFKSINVSCCHWPSTSQRYGRRWSGGHLLSRPCNENKTLARGSTQSQRPESRVLLLLSPVRGQKQSTRIRHHELQRRKMTGSPRGPICKVCKLKERKVIPFFLLFLMIFLNIHCSYIHIWNIVQIIVNVSCHFLIFFRHNILWIYIVNRWFIIIKLCIIYRLYAVVLLVWSTHHIKMLV